MSEQNGLFDMKGKTVALTGGGGVIAVALAEGFLQAGANVSLWDIHGKCNDDAKIALDEKTGYGQRIHCAVADAMSETSVRAAVDSTLEATGRLDVLINTAGGNRGKSSS